MPCWCIVPITVSKVPLTDLARTGLFREKSPLPVYQVCGIAAFPQQLWQENLVWVETSGLKSFNGPSLNTQPPRVKASQESCPGWGALWADIGFGEPHTVTAQLLHSRCLETWVVPRDLVSICWFQNVSGCITSFQPRSSAKMRMMWGGVLLSLCIVVFLFPHSPPFFPFLWCEVEMKSSNNPISYFMLFAAVRDWLVGPR